ncbi:TPA: DUF5677 domain-containing protein [Morganella morganii]
MTTNYDLLADEISTIRSLHQKNDATGFFIQECLRFHTISKSLKYSGLDLSIASPTDTRYITHTLTRSLLENFIAIIYIFDNQTDVQNRYNMLLNSFKEDYRKLMNSLQSAPWSNVITSNNLVLQPCNTNWSTTPKLLNVESMLSNVKNDYGDRLNYLYVVYRISSFDTHGRSLEAIFNAVFGQKCNFPILDIDYTFELIASEYLALLKRLRLQSLNANATFKLIP